MNGSMQYLTDKTKRFLWDVSGAFGDIGVLFPIAIALIARNGFDPSALFLMAGLFYIASACYFKITMPVQPLKAMSAIAIASGIGFEVINAAGIMIGVVLILIAATGLSIKIGALFPLSVIRGVQLGLGFMLVRSSLKIGAGDIAMAVIAGLFLIASITVIKKMPPLIPLLLIGFVVAIKGIKLSNLGPMPLTPAIPDMGTLWTGFTVLVIPQIALTFGNAVVAAESTAKLLYREKASRLNLKSIPLSMGIANVISGIMGGVPMCHGSGGLTAHCKFGATTKRSGYIIGFALVILALVFARSAFTLISAFPAGILAVLLCYVGIQHSLFIKDILWNRLSVFVALTVALVGFFANNLTVGFMTGFAMHYAFAFKNKKIRGSEA